MLAASPGSGHAALPHNTLCDVILLKYFQPKYFLISRDNSPSERRGQKFPRHRDHLNSVDAENLPSGGNHL